MSFSRESTTSDQIFHAMTAAKAAMRSWASTSTAVRSRRAR